MKPYVALLRGINVGGRHALPMRELTATLERLGCVDVATYIQSGNVVFRSDVGADALASAVASAVLAERGFEPSVLVLGAAAFAEAVSRSPFEIPSDDPKALHFGFLSSVPDAPDLDAIEALRGPSERWALVGRVFYLLAPDGIGRSKLAARAERLLGCPMTDRNGRTVSKLLELLGRVSA